MTKWIGGLFAGLAFFAIACGGDDGGGETGNSAASVTIPVAEADRIAHEALITVADLPGTGWQVVAEDDFGEDSGDEFLAMLEGTPECEELENLATLGSIFGDAEEEEEEPAGRAQRELERQDPDSFLPTGVEVEIEIEASAAGSRAEFQIVRELFESERTKQCLITVLNRQFTESGPGGMEVEVSPGTNSAEAPNDGARMAFDVTIAVAGVEIDMAMQMYFWPYGNANVEVMFVGTNGTLTDALIENVLSTVDENLRTVTGG